MHRDTCAAFTLHERKQGGYQKSSSDKRKKESFLGNNALILVYVILSNKDAEVFGKKTNQSI